MQTGRVRSPTMRGAIRFSRLLVPLMVWLALTLSTVTSKLVVPSAHASPRETPDSSLMSSASSCRPLHPIQEEMLPFVHDMLTDAYHAYFENAFPHDVLRTLAPEDWREQLGGYGLTLIDALDMLAIMGRHDVFRRTARWLEENVNFDIDVTVSAFETNIRTVGGLLSAHLLYEEGIVPVVKEEHDYQGGLLVLAVDMGLRLLQTYKSALGLLFNSVNLMKGVSHNETDTVANAAAGTFSVEMMLLSRLTNDPRFETAGRWSQQLMHDLRVRHTSLMGDHIRGHDGVWVGQQTSVGTAVDSTVEYNLKSHVLTGDVDEWERYEVQRRALHKFIGRNGFYLHASCVTPTRWTITVHESLASFYPGLLLLGGQRREASTLVWTTHALWRRHGALPEMTDVHSGRPVHTSESYPLRPEHIESIYHMYRATRDPAYLHMGREAAIALHLRTRTAFGFSTLKNVERVDGRFGLQGDMESFLLTETFKYLYLLFDECHPLHLADASLFDEPSDESVKGKPNRSSTVGWVFTTEAHPIPNRLEWWEESAPWQRHAQARAERRQSTDRSSSRETSSPRASNVASERQAKRPPYGALFPVLHSNETADAFAQLSTTDTDDVEKRGELLRTIVWESVNGNERVHLATEKKINLLECLSDRARPYGESTWETRYRHVHGLRKQVERELLAGGLRGGFTSWNGVNKREDACRGASHWPRTADNTSSTSATNEEVAAALKAEEQTIQYEYFCSNHLFKDTEFLTHSLNYMQDERLQ